MSSAIEIMASVWAAERWAISWRAKPLAWRMASLRWSRILWSWGLRCELVVCGSGGKEEAY